MICEVCETNEGITNSGYIEDANGDGVWVCAVCEQKAMIDAEEEAQDVFYVQAYGNVPCIECGKENLRPGEYVVWTPDGQKSFFLCNACDREYTQQMRETAKEEDRRYP